LGGNNLLLAAIGGQTDFENEAWDIFFENINQIKSYILNRLTGNERKEALLLISESVHWYTDLYMNLVKERRDKRLYDLENQADVNTLLRQHQYVLRRNRSLGGFANIPGFHGGNRVPGH